MTRACRIRRMVRPLRVLITSLAALCVSLPPASVAQDEKEELTWYAVEIIVFERTSELGRNAEAWPFEPGLPDLASAVELTSEGLSPEELAGEPSTETSEASETSETNETNDAAPAEADVTPTSPAPTLPRAFQLVAEEEHRLNDAWKSLEISSVFRPLLHIAWIQPGYPLEESRLVHVRNANAALGTVGVATEKNGEASDDEASVDESSGAPVGGEDFGFEATLSPRVTVARDPAKVALDGTLRVHRARYLHVEADLLYYRPLDGDARAAPGDDAGAAPMLDSPDTGLIEQLLAEDDRAPRLFRLTESRRMRSRELHYLDHPMFGMLVEIVPLELPEMPVDAETPVQGDAPEAEGAATEPAPSQTGSGG